MKGRSIATTLFVSIIVVAIAAAYASNKPDGLEWVSEGLGFATSPDKASSLAPFNSYDVPAMGHSFLSTFITGIIGIAAVFIVVYLAGKFILGLGSRQKKSLSIHRQ